MAYLREIRLDRCLPARHTLTGRLAITWTVIAAVSDLLPGRSSGGRGGSRLPDDAEAIVRQVLQARYLTRQRRSVAAVCREITRLCRVRGLQVPSRGTVLRRVAQLDPLKATQARQGRDAARSKRSAGGVGPELTQLLQQVQMDHTPVDVIVVDERHRLPIGRPYVTVAIDVVSRCIAGLVVTLEAPSATSVGLCLGRMATDKQAWLEQLAVDAVWPMSGKPHELYVDNASEFKSEALRRGCEQHGIALSYRPPGLPHFGGILERVIGTMMRLVHDELPGTTFSNVGERGAYDSDGRARRRDIARKTKKGLDSARTRGRVGGRPSVVHDDKRRAILARRAEKQSLREIARGVEVSLSVVHRIVTEHETQLLSSTGENQS